MRTTLKAYFIGLASLIACSCTSSLALDGGNDVFVTIPTGENLGWKTFEILTGNDSLGTRAQEGFVWTNKHAKWDGLGAYKHDANTLRVFINHETGVESTFSRVDLDLANLVSWTLNGIANNNNSNQVSPPGQIVTAVSRGWLTVGSGTNPINNPCSSNVWEADTFGQGLGFVDTLYLTGEETFNSNGKIWVMDVASRTLYHCPALGGASWENACPVDTGRTDTVAVFLAEDIGASGTGTAPLRLYVGQKNPAGNFLERNGLSGGTVYFWDPAGGSINGTISGIFSGGNGAVVSGAWTTAAGGAALFSKLEDVHPNMDTSSSGYGVEVAIASQAEAIFTADFSQVDFVAGDLGANTTSDVTVLFQSGTQEGSNVFAGMDNLVWSPDGCIYVNEDDGEGDIWKIDVDSLLASYAANDFTPSAAQVGDILDSDTVSESSGIIDISAQVGYEPGGVFLTSGQSGTLSINQLAMLVSPTATLISEEECPPFLPGENVGTVANSSLDEISGLAVSRSNPGVFWVHNDSGDPARIFALNSSGTHLGEYGLSGAAAVDYEDIAIGPGPVEETDYLYIADTGNNLLNRSTVVVYRVAEPAATSNQAPVDTSLGGVDSLPMSFPGSTNYDCETLLVDPNSGDIYLVSRDRDGASGNVSFVFRNPAPHAAGVNVTLELVTSFSAPEEIKGGDISPDGTQILLRSGDNDAQVDARWWSWDTTSSLATVFARAGCFVPAALEPQGEAIAFAADGLSYYTISEDLNQPIYHYTLATPPSAPSSLAAATQSSTEIQLNWVDNSNNEDGFELYESTDGTNFTLIFTTPADTASALIGGLQPSTTYHYFVRAVNIAGEADSNIDSATTSPPAPPAAPTGLAAVAVSSSQIDLSWNDGSVDEDGFEIYQSLDGGDFSLIFTTAPDVEGALVSGLQAETTYDYYVRAFISGVGGSNSKIASATTEAVGPTTLFSDGFESGDLIAGGWSVVSPASVTTSAADVGSYGVLLKKSAAITKTIGGAGANTVDISYRRRINSLNSGEFFFAEYSLDDGSNWVEIEKTEGSAPSWASNALQITLPSASFDLRFRLSGNAGKDSAEVDEVLVTGIVTSPNTSPIAVDDSYAVDEDGSFSEPSPGILGNDSDADGDALMAVLVSGPSSGTLNLATDGSFDYSPDPDFSGSDSFTYTANDGIASSAEVTVDITVSPLADPPVASGDSYSIEPNDRLVVGVPGVLANDVDADGDQLTAIFSSAPSNGTLDLATDGSFVYVPDLGYEGPDAFVYTADDGNGYTNNATVMISIEPVAGPTSMHVESIVVNHLSIGKGRKQGYAEVVVLDDLGNPVAGVSVTGSFSEDLVETITGETDAAGLAVFTTSGDVKGSISLTFCVDDLTLTGLSYDSSANIENCDTNY